MSKKTEPTQKQFGKASRTVPHHSQKASKWYPATDDNGPKAVSLDLRCSPRLPKKNLCEV